ncbi:hypothetical protein QQF64_003414 [Cirrhinus molitorella]|uniref:Uncharacterized protein n=1 Tax=Cirrhinus molitorella TaxID=172907 RepID=A0ABR3ML89_9TELE
MLDSRSCLSPFKAAPGYVYDVVATPEPIRGVMERFCSSSPANQTLPSESRDQGSRSRPDSWPKCLSGRN